MVFGETQIPKPSKSGHYGGRYLGSHEPEYSAQCSQFFIYIKFCATTTAVGIPGFGILTAAVFY